MEATAADVIWPWAEQVMEKGSMTPGVGIPADGKLNPTGTPELTWAGHWAAGIERWRETGWGKGGPLDREEALVKTGDKRQNFQVVRGKQPSSLWGCCSPLTSGAKGELARWAEAQE